MGIMQKRRAKRETAPVDYRTKATLKQVLEKRSVLIDQAPTSTVFKHLRFMMMPRLMVETADSKVAVNYEIWRTHKKALRGIVG